MHFITFNAILPIVLHYEISQSTWYAIYDFAATKLTSSRGYTFSPVLLYSWCVFSWFFLHHIVFIFENRLIHHNF